MKVKVTLVNRRNLAKYEFWFLLLCEQNQKQYRASLLANFDFRICEIRLMTSGESLSETKSNSILARIMRNLVKDNGHDPNKNPN
jgi:hypothetical protein